MVIATETSKGSFYINYDEGVVYLFPGDYKFLNKLKDESVSFEFPEGRLKISTNWYYRCKKSHRLTVIRVELTGVHFPEQGIFETEHHVITVPSDKAVKFDIRNGDFIVAYNVRLPRLISDKMFWAAGAHRENRVNCFSDYEKYIDYLDTLDDFSYVDYIDPDHHFAICTPTIEDSDIHRDKFKMYVNGAITKDSVMRFIAYLCNDNDGGAYTTEARAMYVAKSIFGDIIDY